MELCFDTLETGKGGVLVKPKLFPSPPMADRTGGTASQIAPSQTAVPHQHPIPLACSPSTAHDRMNLFLTTAAVLHSLIYMDLFSVQHFCCGLCVRDVAKKIES